MAFSNTIKSLRLSCLMNQAEFGDAIGVSFTTINRWENGRSKPNITAMKAIKAFCAEKNIDFAGIEQSWLGLHVEE